MRSRHHRHIFLPNRSFRICSKSKGHRFFRTFVSLSNFKLDFVHREEAFQRKPSQPQNFGNRLRSQGKKVLDATQINVPHQNKREDNIRAENIRFEAGQVKTILDTWISLGAPKTILAMVSGYRIPFKCRPPLRNWTLKT